MLNLHPSCIILVSTALHQLPLTHHHQYHAQNLIEKILRTKIYETNYWKEHCFGLTAAGIVEKAVELRYVGGTYGGVRKPCEFMCLVLKMLQIQPDKEIILEYIRNEDYKYVRLLGKWERMCVYCSCSMTPPPVLEES